MSGYVNGTTEFLYHEPVNFNEATSVDRATVTMVVTSADYRTMTSTTYNYEMALARISGAELYHNAAWLVKTRGRSGTLFASVECESEYRLPDGSIAIVQFKKAKRKKR
jgi:hypothetical protein